MIKVKHLDFSYKKNNIVLEQISFDASHGQCIAILGNNGAGKSTLIKCLNHILTPQRGIVYINGKDIQNFKRNDIAKSMAYVAQRSLADKLTVFDTVLLGRKPYIKLEPKQKDIEITEAIIKRMGLVDFALRYVDELSGGEMQKVMLARALAQQPSVLLLDEPTSNLDLRNQYEVLSIMREIAKEENICVIIVIHDLNLSIRYCDRFLFIKDNKIYAYGGKEIMTPENISHVYGIQVEVKTICGIDVVIPLPQN